MAYADECASGYSIQDDSGLCKITCGRGDCAADISDCVPYKTLHIGEYELKMPSRYYTAPSLAIKTSNGDIYYAQTSTRNIAHGLKAMRDNITYSIINAEEDFCTIYGIIADPNK